MPSYPKVVLQVAAMAGIAVMLTMAVPAVAAEGPIAPPRERQRGVAMTVASARCAAIWVAPAPGAGGSSC